MSAKETTNVVFVGVGGQGILLASAIVATAALESGYDVKTNEIHGMAQRGGSVLAQVRYGKKVYSPLVPKGTATAIASLERTEAIRYVDYLAPDGLAVISDQVIVPVTVSSGAAKYPELDESGLREIFPKLVYVPAVERATELGNVRAANVILLGALSTKLDLTDEAWQDAIKKRVKPAFVDLNLKAFYLGRDLAQNA
ncbi:MAG: indolepyruvate oxidoreductase subunit beta [Thermoguttaceae bacterium]|nr:indolepyruvate oxidoreductase subunit beta [Thermoguttaceae bacterium]